MKGLAAIGLVKLAINRVVIVVMHHPEGSSA